MEKTKKPCFFRLLGSGFGLGFFPGIPGTLASLFTAILAYFLARTMKIPFLLDIAILFALILIAWLCARKLMKKGNFKDPSWFVLDEISGMWFALLGLPKDKIPLLLSAFVLFRVFDILKPGIIRRVDEMESAGSIILDDLLAAVPAWIAAFLIGRLL